MRRTSFAAPALLLLLLSGCTTEDASPPGQGDRPASSLPTATGTPVPTGSPDTSRDLDSPSSLTVVVNKHRPLVPSDWVPPDLVSAPGGGLLRAEAAEALQGMYDAAADDGVALRTLSTYRSYAEQQSTYASWVATQGQDLADSASARPGFSEHQTGLAVDIGDGTGCDLQVCFKDTAAARWAAEHAWEHGFVLRYPYWEHGTTGYWYESWHFRYVGPGLARDVQDSGTGVLEDVLGLPPAPDYR